MSHRVFPAYFITLIPDIHVTGGVIDKNSYIFVVAVSFPKGRNESWQSLIQVGLLYGRWRHHLPPPIQFRHGTGREGKILQPPALVDSPATTHKAFGPTDLTSMYFLCARRVFSGIGHRTQAFRSGVRCVAAVAEWYRYRIVACLVTSSSPVPLKIRRVMRVKSVES
ncbi:uncharacterized protein TNCV_3641061 [Trichonephila clavipes]|nr:uncharacterized protein TNCV_3641061 [Trichonephila clavipes]